MVTNYLNTFYFVVCTIEWHTPVHDGPVKLMSKCPFMPHLLLSVGGYSFAVWNEGVMVCSLESICRMKCLENAIILLY